MLYLKLHQSDVLHFCANCSHKLRIMRGLGKRYDFMDERPRRTELCNECRAKQKRGVCKPL